MGAKLSHEKTVAVTVIELFAAALGLTVGIVVIVSSIIRWKSMYERHAQTLMHVQ